MQTRMKNKVFEEMSLQAGGSHYPIINPALQEQFGELILKKVVEICKNGAGTQTTGTGAADEIQRYFGVGPY